VADLDDIALPDDGQWMFAALQKQKRQGDHDQIDTSDLSKHSSDTS
jgi:hypothetical protein